MLSEHQIIFTGALELHHSVPVDQQHARGIQSTETTRGTRDWVTAEPLPSNLRSLTFLSITLSPKSKPQKQRTTQRAQHEPGKRMAVSGSLKFDCSRHGDTHFPPSMLQGSPVPQNEFQGCPGKHRFNKIRWDMGAGL